jgi:ADYC domain
MRTTSRASNLAMVLFSASSLLGGCGVQESAVESTVEIGQCDTDWVCGSNSPEIDHYGFHELNLEGSPNLERFQIVGSNGLAQIWKSGRAYTLKVIGSKIYGYYGGRVALYDANLVGAEIRILRDGISGYTIRIDAVRDMRYAVGSQTDVLGAYSLSWYGFNDAPDSKRSICAPPTILPAAAAAAKTPKESTAVIIYPPGNGELLGMQPNETVVFEGDRFDARAKTMTDRANVQWFNLGCAGHTLAKMHLTRHTIASGSDGYGISGKDRQATLKMMVADYCGDGTPFTVAGEPLRWKGGLVYFYKFPSVLEARWTSEGATCLYEPRLRSTTSTLAPQIFGPDIDKAIRDHCTIPRCSDPDANNFAGSLRVSGNP